MFVQMDLITFKSLPIFYEKEKSGIKNNTVRHLSNTEALKVREAERLFLHSDLFIKIKNTETGESFCRILRDISTNDDVTVFTWDEREVPVCCVCVALADEKRNTRIQKYCSFCGQPSKGEEITPKEQALLKCLLGQFNNLFGVE